MNDPNLNKAVAAIVDRFEQDMELERIAQQRSPQSFPDTTSVMSGESPALRPETGEPGISKDGEQ